MNEDLYRPQSPGIPSAPLNEEPENSLPPEEPQKKKISLLKFVLTLGFMGVVAISVGLGLVYWQFSRILPSLISIGDYRPLGVTRVLTQKNGADVLVGEFFKERRYVIPFEMIPSRIVQAFVSAEDDDFFQHQGISLMAILRASIANFRAGHVVQGGSTITQQVAKSLFLTSERSFIRKFKEAILAGRIEKHLTKKQILFLYLNQIYLGHGAYGIQAASRIFFKKDINEITLPEAALLAGMPRAPSKFSPFLNPKRAKERQRYVLRRMFENDFITEDQMIEAAAEPLKVFRYQDVNPQVAPYYLEHLRRELVEKYGENSVYEEGLTVYVASGQHFFKAAREAITVGLREVDKRLGYRGPLKVLSKEEEITQFIEKSRESLIRTRVPYQLLLPDGRIELMAAMENAGFSADEELLEKERIYEALVTDVRDGEEVGIVQIGTVQLSLPFEEMKWARPPANEEGHRPLPPKRPSQVLNRGDIVLVRLIDNPGLEEYKKKKAELLKKSRRTGIELIEDPEPFPFVATLEQTPEVQGALFSMDVQTGNVLAMEGGYDFEVSEFNRALQAQRQPGSAFKPIIFSAAIENGYTPASIIVDSPIVFKDEEIGKWKPSNFGKRFYGDTTFRSALIKSRNIPTIKLVQALQVPTIITYARRLGMTGAFNEDLSISLGSATTNLVELTKVYSLFPRQGRKVSPIFINKVVDRDGLVLEENRPQDHPFIARLERELGENGEPIPPESVPLPEDREPTLVEGEEDAEALMPSYFPPPDDPEQLLDSRVAYVMTYLMKEVVSFGTGKKAQGLGRPAAGKTGTTNEYKDAWFMGFTPQIVTGVWVGFDDQAKSLGPGETGSRAALPIWLNFMKRAVDRYPGRDFGVPAGITFSTIDARTGKLARVGAVSGRREAFIAGTEPTRRSAPKGQGSAVDSQSEFLKESF